MLLRETPLLNTDALLNMKIYKQQKCTPCGKNVVLNNNNNNNIYLLQLGCHPVAVVILHVYKT